MGTTRSLVRRCSAVVAVLCLGGLAACTGSGATDPGASSSPVVGAPSTAPPPSTSSTATSSTATSSPGAGEQPASFGILEAIAAARKAEDGAVTGAELDRYGETSAWKVEIRRSRTVTVELVLTSDGRVQDTTKDDTDDEARTVPDYEAAAAIKAAQKRVEGQPTSVELDTEGGRRVWEVKVSRPGDQPLALSYDADSGSFVRQRVDS